MDRRQFIKGISALFGASVIPVTNSVGEVISVRMFTGDEFRVKTISFGESSFEFTVPLVLSQNFGFDFTNGIVSMIVDTKTWLKLRIDKKIDRITVYGFKRVSGAWCVYCMEYVC